MIFVRSKTSIGDVVLDATLRVKHQIVAQVSTSPLEDGVDITDHVRILPQNMEIVGIITPTENTLLAQFGPNGGPAAALGISGGERDVEAWNDLTSLILARKRLEIVTRYKTYFVLPIELLADEDAGFGMALQFTMRFLEIEIGTVESLDGVADLLKDTVAGKTGSDNLGLQQVGDPETVPANDAKPKPQIVNPWTGSVGVAA